MLRWEKGRVWRLVPTGKNKWEMMPDVKENLNQLTFLCMIEVISFKTERILPEDITPIMDDGMIECLWNIDEQDLKRFLQSKSDKMQTIMYSDDNLWM